MQITRYDSIQKALTEILSLNVESRIVTHSLRKGQKVRAHLHQLATEWIILSKGKAEISFNKTWEEVDVPNDTIIVVTIPPLTVHSLNAKTPLKYFVVRDKEAKTEYIR